VSQHVDDPTRWILHEVYDAPESHAAHRQSPHLLACAAFAREPGSTASRSAARHLT
jgi:quinol monooxygenase YgiN